VVKALSIASEISIGDSSLSAMLFSWRSILMHASESSDGVGRGSMFTFSSVERVASVSSCEQLALFLTVVR